jgi:hypothetical protein
MNTDGSLLSSGAPGIENRADDIDTPCSAFSALSEKNIVGSRLIIVSPSIRVHLWFPSVSACIGVHRRFQIPGRG